MKLYSWTTFYLYIQIEHVYVPFLLYVNYCASHSLPDIEEGEYLHVLYVYVWRVSFIPIFVK